MHLLLNFHESYLKYLASVKVQKKKGLFGIFRVQLHSNGRQVCSLICSERRENWRPKAAPEAQSRAKQPRAALVIIPPLLRRPPRTLPHTHSWPLAHTISLPPPFSRSLFLTPHLNSPPPLFLCCVRVVSLVPCPEFSLNLP